MNRVSTANNYSTVLADLMRAQTRQYEAQNQVTTGKVGSDLKAFAKDAETLMAARSIQTRVEGFIEQGKTLSAKLETQALAITEMEDAAAGARQVVAEALANGRGDGLAGELASLFASAADALNTQFGGRYIFAGAQVNTPPVAARLLSDLTAVPAVADVFRNDALIPVNRLDESTTVQSGFLADELGGDLFGAFRQLQAYVETNGAFSGQLTAAQTTFLEGLLGSFGDARAGLTDATVRNGLTQSRVDKALDAHGARQDMLDGMIGDVTNVDMAEAVTRLQQAQTAVQASAQVFMTLQGSSLLELLK